MAPLIGFLSLGWSISLKCTLIVTGLSTVDKISFKYLAKSEYLRFKPSAKKTLFFLIASTICLHSFSLVANGFSKKIAFFALAAITACSAC